MMFTHLFVILLVYTSTPFAWENTTGGWTYSKTIYCTQELMCNLWMGNRERRFISIPRIAEDVWTGLIAKATAENGTLYSNYKISTVQDRAHTWLFTIASKRYKRESTSVQYSAVFEELINLMNCKHAYESTLSSDYVSVAVKAIPLYLTE